eukprot:TRINITY_DN59440_c0_g1_i1.p1 TRINITY_DN59440_c0_g1~~TRINITY_DN59440_c0_g1_i1.p1  ORF type:complete len:392 (-),score=37.59 TRINITY_DN59440_c0_g1_i1:255-1430(-)
MVRPGSSHRFRLCLLLQHAVLTCSAPAQTPIALDDRIAGALYGMLIGDALAMPVHWYYGGPSQIKKDFGGSLLNGYERAVHPYPDSIMQLSNTGGGGRGGDQGEIVGNVILHDKKPYWKRGGQYHYHHTLSPGENTLEGSLARLLVRTISDHGGRFDADAFTESYIEFMTTPGTHNDTYASTCHRMFFQNWQAGKDPQECPDNDGHNVDTMDGLVLPLVVALAELSLGKTAAEATASSHRALRITRRSSALPEYISVTTEMLAMTLSGTSLHDAASQTARTAYGSSLADEVGRRGDSDPMVACYIGGSFPALLHFAYKYGRQSPRDALLASANAGGENVHRGLVFGALVGASVGQQGLPADLLTGLFNYADISEEVLAFVHAVAPRDGTEL